MVADLLKTPSNLLKTPDISFVLDLVECTTIQFNNVSEKAGVARVTLNFGDIL